MSFGPIDADSVRFKYRQLKAGTLAYAWTPGTIVIDKRPAREWSREKVQCVIAHEYGHLAGYRDESNQAEPEHSDNPRSIMYFRLQPRPCHRWLVRHGLSE